MQLSPDPELVFLATPLLIVTFHIIRLIKNKIRLDMELKIRIWFG